MKKMILFGLMMVAIAASSAFTHNFYVSICQIDHNPATQSLEISHRIFLDDFEKALESLGTGNLKFGEPDESPKTEGYVQRYMMMHFKVKVDGEPVQWKYVGREIENDVIWIYLEVNNQAAPASITIENDVLVDVFDAQSNMINFKVGEVKKSLLLNAATKKGTVTFKE